MSITIADGRLAAEFAGTADATVVRGPDGKIIGKFIPEQAPPPPNISEEELQRREDDRTSKTHTAAEVEAKIREWRCTL